LCLLANIWTTNNLTDVVISGKLLDLKFLPYIAEIKGWIIKSRAIADPASNQN
jgi:hypothetical protein